VKELKVKNQFLENEERRMLRVQVQDYKLKEQELFNMASQMQTSLKTP
jgi:hypothetical protein